MYIKGYTVNSLHLDSRTLIFNEYIFLNERTNARSVCIELVPVKTCHTDVYYIKFIYQYDS